MSEIQNGGLDSMAKCKALTGSAVKGLNRCVFSNWQNSGRVSSESRTWRGKLFQSRCPATVKGRADRLVQILGTLDVVTVDS